jgi:long-subunit fatty acid transport protein
MEPNTGRKKCNYSWPAFLTVILLFSCHNPSAGQGGRYWDQNLNSEAALLSGAVVAGEGGIAAIFYNPATIPEMKKTNLSLSANLFSTYYFKAKDALGADFPADRFQFNIYPRIITLTLKPVKNPDLTIEMAYFAKSNEYMVINKGISSEGDIIDSNPGNEFYNGEYYMRSKYQDYNGGAGIGYKLSDKLAVGFSGLISYKDDQFYNLITANAFTMPGPDPSDSRQYLSSSGYHIKYNMFDVRLTTKLGLHLKQNSWSFGANINLPSVKLFGNGTVVKQYQYSNIHSETGNTEGYNRYYAGRQSGCAAHFKDPLSIAVGANYYSPSGRSILLFTTEYFFGLKQFDYMLNRRIGSPFLLRRNLYLMREWHLNVISDPSL